MNLHRINVFFSHAWLYSEHDQKLHDWIFKEKWTTGTVSVDFHDVSLARNFPITDQTTQQQIRDAVYERVGQADLLVMPMGMYVNHGTWIQRELDGADYHTKPILAVNPSSQDPKSSVVAGRAEAVVGLDKDAVVAGIWNLYYQNVP